MKQRKAGWSMLFITSIILLFVIGVAAHGEEAHGEEDFSAAEELIASKVDCKELSDGQLEAIGEYYMEQMHPGELHEQMDEMMGGEGSVQLQQMHINMARSFYCGEHGAMDSGMMDMMMGRSNMVNGGMMGQSDMMGRGMMGGTGIMGNSRYGGAFTLLYAILLIGIIILLYLWVFKLWKRTKNP